MSEHDEAGDVQVSTSDEGSGEADLATVPDAEAPAPDCHVITLQDAAGWELSHPVSCDPGSCRVAEAAGRISRGMCATGGTWTCDADPSGLMLLERIGD